MKNASKIIIHNKTRISDLDIMLYIIETLKVVESKNLKVGENRYFKFSSNVRTQICKNKSCLTIYVY